MMVKPIARHEKEKANFSEVRQRVRPNSSAPRGLAREAKAVRRPIAAGEVSPRSVSRKLDWMMVTRKAVRAKTVTAQIHISLPQRNGWASRGDAAACGRARFGSQTRKATSGIRTKPKP